MEDKAKTDSFGGYFVTGVREVPNFTLDDHDREYLQGVLDRAEARWDAAKLKDGFEPLEGAPAEGTFFVLMPEPIQGQEVLICNRSEERTTIGGYLRDDLPIQPIGWKAMP